MKRTTSKNKINVALNLDRSNWQLDDILLGFRFDDNLLDKIEYTYASILDDRKDEVIEAWFKGLNIKANPKFKLNLVESDNFLLKRLDITPSINELVLPKFKFSKKFLSEISKFLLTTFQSHFYIENLYNDNNLILNNGVFFFEDFGIIKINFHIHQSTIEGFILKWNSNETNRFISPNQDDYPIGELNFWIEGDFPLAQIISANNYRQDFHSIYELLDLSDLKFWFEIKNIDISFCIEFALKKSINAIELKIELENYFQTNCSLGDYQDGKLDGYRMDEESEKLLRYYVIIGGMELSFLNDIFKIANRFDFVKGITLK